VNSYAISLFALIERAKVDTGKDIPEELGEQLGLFLQRELGITILTTQILQAGDDSLLLLKGIEDADLPALLALADVQKTQLFRYERDAEDAVTLTPIAVDPNAGEK